MSSVKSISGVGDKQQAAHATSRDGRIARQEKCDEEWTIKGARWKGI